MSFDAKKYIPVIDVSKDQAVELVTGACLTISQAILGVSDLEVITAKRIRRGIQELFAVDLSDYKKEVDNVIMERFLKIQAEEYSEDESSNVKEEEYPDISQDKHFAERLSTELNRRDLRDARKKRATPPQKKKKTTRESTDKRKTANTNNPFNKPMLLSPQLAELLGETELSRPQTVKMLWAYIKENELQNPQDKREILLDDKLKAAFGVDKVTGFSLNKYLSKHLYKKDEVVTNN